MSIGYQDKLKIEIEICVVHENRLKMSLQHIQRRLPLTRQFFEKPSDEDLAFLDMTAMRFAKLQDTLGKKILPLILRLTNDYEDSETFIDRLNRLERLGVIESAQQWRILRDIQNTFSHEYEYENDIDKLCGTFNFFIEKCDELLALWNHVQSYIKQKKLLLTY